MEDFKTYYDAPSDKRRRANELAEYEAEVAANVEAHARALKEQARDTLARVDIGAGALLAEPDDAEVAQRYGRIIITDVTWARAHVQRCNQQQGALLDVQAARAAAAAAAEAENG